jgi:PUA-domain protein
MPPVRHLKGKESKQIIKEFLERYPMSIDSLSSVSHIEEQVVADGVIFFADGKPLILRTKRGLIPSLKFDAVVNALPKIIVDMGAVRHVVNGAQIMRPGIRQIEGRFSNDDLVAIQDEKYRKTIALGVAEVNSEAMWSMDKGRVIDNIHFVGDTLWNSFSASKP